MNITYVPIDSIIPYDKNPRKNQGAISIVARSIQEFGWQQPIVVDEDRVVIVGHTRLEAAKQMGLESVPVLVAMDMTPEKVKAYRIADNQTGAIAEWDFELLKTELQDLQLLNYDLANTAFNPEEISAIFGTTEVDKETAGSQPYEGILPENAITKPGDVIELGRHRLMCGNSLAMDEVRKLLNGAEPTMAYLDPPYGISVVKMGKNGGDKAFGSNGSGQIIPSNLYAPIIGDNSIDTARGVYQLCVLLKLQTIIMWGGNHYANVLPNQSEWIVWNKETGSNDFSDFEMAWTNKKGGARMFTHKWNGMLKASEQGNRRVHPTQKPIALAKWCFERYGYVNENVLDLFGGSGSTLMAAEESGRNCYMMEMSTSYCDVIVNRWQDATGKTANRL